jgi:hypothetical protein
MEMNDNKPTTIGDDSDELEITAEAPEQKATHRWEFKSRQAQKWGTVTKQGLIVGRAPNQRTVPPDEVYYLASLGCTNREIAEWFGIHENTLAYNFKEYIAKAQEETKQKLRQAQLKAALGGNVAMLIWLGKNMLGQSDNPTNTDADKILPWHD